MQYSLIPRFSQELGFKPPRKAKIRVKKTVV